MKSFENENVETFVKNRPGTSFTYSLSAEIHIVLAIKTFEKELFDNGINALKSLERADGVADPDEVTRVVVNRSGNILSASTIIKSDFFCNLQKMTLPE